MKKVIVNILVLTLFLYLSLYSGTGHTAQNEIYIVKVADAISPGVADFLKRGIEKANDENAACLIIEMDTPGGLAESMRSIIKAILASRIPVIVYVAPSGARAASLSTRSSFSA